jgi:hypothetical protein
MNQNLLHRHLTNQSTRTQQAAPVFEALTVYMKIERYINDQGDFRCFAVNNRKVSRSGMVKILSELNGVKILHHPKYNDIEVFCEFELDGHKFEISEPYGDSSDYDVTAPEPNLGALDLLAEHFEKSAPIKGGDSGHNLFFFINWMIFSAIVMAVGYGVWSGIQWIIS